MNEQPSPLIIPRSEHCLSRNGIDPAALKVLYRLHHHGFTAYLVGGCVRDLLLGKTPRDFDVATNAHPQQIRELFHNSRLIGRRFRLVQVYFHGGKTIEVSTFRRRSEFEEAGEIGPPHPENTFGTPVEDAFRRDITINGIFYNIADFSIVDYVSGLGDLRQGVIRCIGDPEEKFVHDPVRMLRVIRHAARTGFPIEEKTYQCLLGHVERLGLCSPARVRDEFLRELQEGSAEKSMALMIQTGMLFILFPLFRPLLNEEGQKEYFLRIIGALDSLYVSENTPSEEFFLSLFLYPLFKVCCRVDDFPPGRKGQTAFHQNVREWLGEILGPLQFTRQGKEAASNLLSTQRIFREFLPGRKLPLRLMRKPYFLQAHLLSDVEARARGEGPEVLGPPAEERKVQGRKKKRRHRRQRRRLPLADRALDRKKEQNPLTWPATENRS